MPRIPYSPRLPPRFLVRTEAASAASPISSAERPSHARFTERPWPLDPSRLNWGAWLPKHVRSHRPPAVTAPAATRAPTSIDLNPRRSPDDKARKAKKLRERLMHACMILDSDHWAELFAFVLELAEWTRSERRSHPGLHDLPFDWSAAAWLSSPLQDEPQQNWLALGFRNLLVSTTQSASNTYRYSDALEARIRRAEDMGFRVLTSVDIHVPESQLMTDDPLKRVPMLQALEAMLRGVANEVVEGTLGVRAASVDKWYAPLEAGSAEHKTHAVLSLMKLFLRMVAREEVLYADEASPHAENDEHSKPPSVSLKYQGSSWEEEDTSSEGDILTGADIRNFFELSTRSSTTDTYGEFLISFHEPLFHGHILHRVGSDAYPALMAHPDPAIALKAIYLLAGTLSFDDTFLVGLDHHAELCSIVATLNAETELQPSLWAAELSPIAHAEGPECAFLKQFGTEQILAVLNLGTEPLDMRWALQLHHEGPVETRSALINNEAKLTLGEHVRIYVPARELAVWVNRNA